jgi:hypothetical protein
MAFLHRNESLTSGWLSSDNDLFGGSSILTRQGTQLLLVALKFGAWSLMRTGPGY